MIELLLTLFVVSFIIGSAVYFLGDNQTKQKRDEILKDIDNNISKKK
jgi:type II secretory pathway pseudopilin PulG